MELNFTWQLGCWLMGIAAMLYVCTWIVTVVFPVLLMGNVANLWLKTLANVLLGGLFLTILWGINGLLLTFLSGRR